MKLNKLIYYIKSLCILILHLKNPLSLSLLLFKKRTTLHFTNSTSFIVEELLDALILKETLFDDVYKISLLKNPQMILDVGAGFGDFSISVSKLFPQATIIAFEPEKRSTRLLKENIAINNVGDSIKFHTTAIGTHKQYTLAIAKNATQSSVIPTNGAKQYTVPGISLNSFIMQDIALLKIDCEGAEVDILKSISAQMIKRIKCIALEYHNHLFPNEDKVLLQLLRKLGFITSQKPDPYDENLGYIYAKRPS